MCAIVEQARRAAGYIDVAICADLVDRRRGAAIGFAFVGREGAGPMAALDTADVPALLTHVETRAAALGVERLNVQVPGLNAAAVHRLLGRGFRIDPWINLLMSNKPFGQFDRFIAFSPVFL